MTGRALWLCLISADEKLKPTWESFCVSESSLPCVVLSVRSRKKRLRRETSCPEGGAALIFIPIIILLLIGFYYLVAALGTAFGIAILIFSVGVGAFFRLPVWLLTRRKRGAAAARRQLFEENVKWSLDEHERRFPDEDEFDENGIPYL